jgi:hypothetical protein
MTLYGLWHGGHGSYSEPNRDDLESFPDIEAARQALADRQDHGYWQRQDFAYVTREPESVFTPCVADESHMYLFLVDPRSLVEQIGDAAGYPDTRITRTLAFDHNGDARPTTTTERMGY